MAAALPRVGILYAPRGPATLRDILRACQGIAEPVVILPPGERPDARSLEAAAYRLFERVLTCSPTGEPTDPATAEQAALSGVITFNDSELERAAGFARAVGLPTSNASQVADKLYQRKTLGAAGLTRIGAMAVDSAADLAAAVEALGLPSVLKPRRGVGGFRVRVLREPADVAEVSPNVAPGMMLEQYIPDEGARSADWLADYVSVEACSTATDHHVLARFGKLPVATVDDPDAPAGRRMVTTGDVLSHGGRATVDDDVVELVRRSLDALDLRDSLSHTEVKLGAGGPEIIETNCRLGGHLSRLTNRRQGLDMVRLGVRQALGDTDAEIRDTPPDGAVAGVFVPFDPRAGEVRSAVSARDLRELPGVASVDEFARPATHRADTDAIVANVVLEAAGLDELRVVLREYLTGLSALYAADGVGDTRWMKSMMEALG